MRIVVPGLAGCPIELVADDPTGHEPYRVSGLTVRAGAGQTASFAFVEPLVLDQRLVDRNTKALKTFADIRREAEAQIEDAFRTAVRDLASRKLDFHAEADFFGRLPFKGALSASAKAEARLDLAPLLVVEGSADENTPVLAVEASAAYALELGETVAKAARLALTVRLFARAKAELHLTLPDLGIELPALDFRDLGWPSGVVKALSGLAIRPPRLPVELRQPDDQAPDVEVTYTEGASNPLSVKVSISQLQLVYVGSGTAPVLTLTNVVVTFADGKLIVAGLAEARHEVTLARREKTFSWLEAEYLLTIEAGRLVLGLSKPLSGGEPSFGAYLDLPLVRLESRSDPAARIGVRLGLPFAEGGLQPSVTLGPTGQETTYQREIALREPSQAELAAAILEHLPDLGALRVRLPRLGLPNIPGPPPLDPAPLIAFARGLLRLLAKGAAGLAGAVTALLETALRLVGRLLATVGEHVTLELILDADTFALRQVLIGLPPATDATGDSPQELLRVLGLVVQGSPALRWALLLDVQGGARDICLVAVAGAAGEPKLVFGTDLWLDGDAQRQATEQAQSTGAPPAKPLIAVTVEREPAGTAFAFVPAGLVAGRPVFLRALEPAPSLDGEGRITLKGGQPYRLVPATAGWKLTAELPSSEELKDRLLPFLGRAPLGGLGQAVQLELEEQPVVAGDVLTAKARLLVKLGDAEARAPFQLAMDLRRMTLRLEGGRVGFEKDFPLAQSNTTRSFDLLGLAGELHGVRVSSDAEEAATGRRRFRYLDLDLRSGDARLALAEVTTDGKVRRARLELTFDRLAAGPGQALVFDVKSFAVSRGGLDLEAELQGGREVVLNGLAVPFRFEAARLIVLGGRPQSLVLRGAGRLPPTLLGEIDARIVLAFAGNEGGRFGLSSADIDLAAPGKPIRCGNTGFELALDGVKIRAFEEKGYHFCAFITGQARFRPESSALARGLLGKLGEVTLRFVDCPVCGDGRVIRRKLESELRQSFTVELEKPARANLFELFEFEVRSLGFEPDCPLFGGEPGPALKIGGQVNFAEIGDVVDPDIEFHALWIAPPAGGKGLPRIRFEGLKVKLQLGDQVRVAGSAAAVDGSLPSLVRPPDLPTGITAEGFMGSGEIAIQGLPPMAASFGFLEIVDDRDLAANGDGEVRPERKRAWFVYLQANRISYRIPIPLIELYLREAGFGFGFRYTLAGIKAAEAARSPGELIKVLDEVAKRQGDLAEWRAWQPDIERRGEAARFTFALRGMFAMSSAAPPNEPFTWRPAAEQKLPNPLLFDVVAALRSDFTFLMTVRGWIGHNYWDWDRRKSELSGRQSLTGYLLLSGPRSELLARLTTNPAGEIGERAALPKALLDGLKKVEVSATLYCRPGLFHFELGWPDRVRYAEKFGPLSVSIRGGLIWRLHEDALIAGLNLAAEGRLELAGGLDAGSFGVTVSAVAEVKVAARIIGRLDARAVANSFYYSRFDLYFGVTFRVSAWLEIDAWLCKITIRIGFAIELQVAAALELAISLRPAIGARAQARVSVSIFGMSLGVGIDLRFNYPVVEDARARVERYLQLGLEQDVPAAAPALEDRDSAHDERGRLERERRKAEAVAATTAAAAAAGGTAAHVPGAQPDPTEKALEDKGGFEIAATDFRIVLTYPSVLPDGFRPGAGKPAAADWCYLTFLPIATAESTRSSFYAAPPAKGETAAPDHQVSVEDSEGALGGLKWWRFDPHNGSWTEATMVGMHDTAVDWSARMAVEEKSDPSAPEDFELTLKRLFFAAFRNEPATVNSPEDVNKYLEPRPRKSVATTATKPPGAATAAERSRLRREAAHTSRKAELECEHPIDRRAHDARDVLLQSFVSDLFTLAREGAAPGGRVHALKLGLTFLIKRTDARTLAEAFETSAKIHVLKRVLNAGHARSNPCRIFNPPGRTFADLPPRFVGERGAVEGGKVLLDWDLKWDIAEQDRQRKETRPEEESEPEHFLQHYVVTRRIESLGDVAASDLPEREVTFKRCDQIGAEKDGVRELLRGDWQFADDLSDLGEAARRELLQRDEDVVIRYTMVPVDVSGTRGVPLAIAVRRPAVPDPLAPSLVEAELRFKVNAGGKHTFDAAELSLAVQAGIDAEGPKEVLPGARWRLVLRPEPVLAAGSYGADALTTAGSGGVVGVERRPRKDDIIFDIDAGTLPEIGRREGGVLRPVLIDGLPFMDGPTSKPERFRELYDVLRSRERPTAFRLFVQAVAVVERQRDGTSVEYASSLTPAALAVVLERELPRDSRAKVAGPADPAADFRLRPLTLEWPRAEGLAETLRPIPAVDLDARAGRVALLRPTADVTWNSLASPSSIESAMQPAPDPLSRLGTVLRFNHRPSGGGVQLAAGYEVPALDLDGLADSEVEQNGMPKDDPWRRAPAERVKLTMPATARLVPADTLDAAAWEASYPSHAARAAAGGAWYSPAESYAKWPRPELRRRLLPEPPDDLLADLTSAGPPDRLACRLEFRGDPGLRPPGLKLLALGLLDGAVGSAEGFDIDAPAGSSIGVGGEAGLRSLLGRLVWGPKDTSEAKEAFERLREDRRAWAGWVLVLRSLRRSIITGEKDVELASAEVPLAFDAGLHALLTELLAEMRREGTSDGKTRVLELDRRPVPPGAAKEPAGFLSETGAERDPYGWTTLQRLGLAVTVRLFDPANETFLEPSRLAACVHRAIEVRAAQLYPEACKHLVVELLLKPGRLVRLVPFDSAAEPDPLAIDDDGLAMVQLSLRPRIEGYLTYYLCGENDLEKDENGALKVQALPDAAVDVLEPTASDNLTTVPAGTMRTFNPPPGPDGQRTLLLRSRAATGLPGSVDPGPGGDRPDAFGRFPPFGGWPGAMIGAAGKPATSWRDFLAYVLATLQLEDVPDEAAQRSLQAAYLPWAQRFLDHAAPQAATGAVIALAAPRNASPRLLAPNEEGCVSVLLIERDRWRHTRRLAVLPYGRYDALLEGAGRPRPERPNPKLDAADVTVPRTAPLVPPLVLSARRIGDTQVVQQERPLGIEPGREVEVILARHPEATLAAANRALARRLALGANPLLLLLREPADKIWAKAFGVTQGGEKELFPLEDALPAADLLEKADLKAPWGDTLQRAPAAWRGATAWRLPFLPHWYRHHLALAVAAGRSVSPPAVATLADVPARLPKPGDEGDPLAAAPRWTLEAGGDGLPALRLEVEALLYRDTTDAETRELHGGTALAWLPDPEVVYETLLAGKGTPRVETPTAEIRRAERENGDVGQLFQARPVGRGWVPAAKLTAPTGQPGRHRLQLDLRPEADVALPPEWDPPLKQALADKLAATLRYRLEGDKLRIASGLRPLDLKTLDGLLDQAGGKPEQRDELERRLARALDQGGRRLPLQPGAFDQLAGKPLPAEALRRRGTTLRLARPADEDALDQLREALAAWATALARLERSSGRRGALDLAAQVQKALELGWPAAWGDAASFPLSWDDALPEPQEPLALKPAQDPMLRVEWPGLITDAEAGLLLKALSDAGVPPAEAKAVLKAARAAVLGAYELQLRITRGPVPPRLIPIGAADPSWA